MFEGQSRIEMPGITFMTYQTAEEILDPDNVVGGMPYYSVVVMDEIAYLATDCMFNPKTMRTANYIKTLTNSTVIFISATIESVMDYIFPDWEDWYHIGSGSNLEVFQNSKPEFDIWARGLMQNLYWYSSKPRKQQYRVIVFDTVEEIVEMINHDDSGSKWLVFQSNIKRAKTHLLPKITKSVSMITAANKKTEEMDNIVKEMKFEATVLVATKVLDVGVSLHDDEILNVVMNADNKFDFVQMLGRRRIKKDENCTINVYLPRRSVQHFSTKRINDVEPALKFLNLTSAERLKEIISSESGRKRAQALCDRKADKLITNWIAKAELEKKRKMYLCYEEGLEADPDFFIKEQMSWLGEGNVVEVVDYSQIKVRNSLDTLKQNLEKRIDLEMDKKEQGCFRLDIKPTLHSLLPNRFPNKKNLPGIKLINDCLRILEIPIIVESISQHNEGEETKWVVKRATLT